MSSTEQRLKALILVSGILLAVLLGTAGAIKLTMSPDFCSKCHVMAPEYTTWKASSHIQVACVDCHIKPGLGNLIVHKISAMKELYLYFTGTYERPIKMSHKIEDEICTACHSTNRDTTPSGDLIIPHAKHASKKVLCIECHSGVAHGNIVARNMTEDGNYAVWTSEYGAAQMSKDYSEPKMNTCLKCHMERGVTQECRACHTSISLPPDHKVKSWGTNHGIKARGDLEYCNKCHSYSVAAKDIPIKDPVTRYARGNVFCVGCHQLRPAGHTEDWKMVHKRGVKNGDTSSCLVCHNNEKPTSVEKSVPTYCAKCHGKSASTVNGNVYKSGNSTFNKIHPANWRKIHPSIVKEKGAYNEGCWNCHDTSHCSKCHMNKL